MAQKKATAQGNETTYFNHIMKISMAKEVAIFLTKKILTKDKSYAIIVT